MRNIFSNARGASARPLLAASFGLVLVFTLSCSSGDIGDGNLADKNGTFTDDRDGQSYGWTKIGTQVWLTKNLNYNATGSKCYGEGGRVMVSYDEEKGEEIYATLSGEEAQVNCTKYGELYDWSTAMALPSSCNSISCPAQINAKHKGICPKGWHIPSEADWKTLADFVGGEEIAGTKLISTNGWDTSSNTSSNYKPGTDDYGFSALPGGSGKSDGNFDNVSYKGYWWSATEFSASSAWLRGIRYGRHSMNSGSSDKSGYLSVRCVQD